MKFNKHLIYISLFAILYLIVAFSSFWHAVAFFGLANNSWMSVILAFAFEIGQAAVLFSLLTSKKDRGRIMPWVLMGMFTLVQVIGNVYSSYKYIITNSVDNLRYFKEPIFIWTDLPNDQANVIIVYLVGALLPIAALLLTSMITNYLSDIDEVKNEEPPKEITFDDPISTEGDSLLNQNSILSMENQGLQESLDNKNAEIEELKKRLKEHETSKETRKEVSAKIEDKEYDNKEEIQATDLKEDEQTNEEGIKENEKEEDQLNNISSESSEKIIDEEQRPLETKSKQPEETVTEDPHTNDEEQIREENTKSNELVAEDMNDKSGYIIGDPGDPGITDENLKVADALMGGNILNQHKKESHFINNKK